MARIAVIGPASQDIYLSDNQKLAPTNIGSEAILGKILVGSHTEIDKLSYRVGGSGLNAAVEFSRHGHEAVLLGNIAKDAAGNAVMNACDAEGIDSSYLNFVPRTATSTEIILLDSDSGNYTSLSAAGAAKSPNSIDVYDLETIAPDWLFITTLSGDFFTLNKIMKKAKELGIKIMFCPGEKEIESPKKLIDLFKYVDIIAMNKKKAAQIVPGTVLSELLSHLGNYIKNVIITDGQMGGIATNGTESYRFGLYESLKIKDLNGAGVAFNSGFLAHLASGKSFRTSLVYASANSISVVSKLGGYTGALMGTEPLHPMPIQKI